MAHGSGRAEGFPVGGERWVVGGYEGEEAIDGVVAAVEAWCD